MSLSSSEETESTTTVGMVAEEEEEMQVVGGEAVSKGKGGSGGGFPSVKNDDIGGDEVDDGDGAKEKGLRRASLRELLRYADCVDWCFMIVGGVNAVAGGLSGPVFAIILGSLYSDFTSTSDIVEIGETFGTIYGLVAVGLLVTGFFQVALFTITSERQVLRYRKAYVDAVLAKDIAWFDVNGGSHLTTKIAENTREIKEALGEKLGHLLYYNGTAFGGLIVAFVTNWKVSLVVVAVSPLLIIGGYMSSKFTDSQTNGSTQAYSAAGALAEEALGMIRTVASFGLERRFMTLYNDELSKVEEFGIRKSKYQAVGMAFTFGIYFLVYALAFWFGSTLVIGDAQDAATAFPPNPNATNSSCQVDGSTISPELSTELGCINTNNVSFVFINDADVCACTACNCGCSLSGDCTDGGSIITVFFSIVMGAFAAGNMGPFLSAFNQGRLAAKEVIDTVDTAPVIDTRSDKGVTLDTIKGDFRLEKVEFFYPARPDRQVLQGIDLHFVANQTTALVGGSGCGKSTIAQLLLRLYDPTGGRITLDGRDMREINLRWLRGNIGYVGQEPVLFATTIAANIRLGAGLGDDPTEEMINEATNAANAYNFINEFPNGLETQCGGKGGKLSGGQRQRLAIARALIRDPSILILDEATSALDNESERIVQAALDEVVATKARTTVVIAHRLSTVRRSNKIVVLGPPGVVLEQGTHEELLGIEDGHYLALVHAAERSQEYDGKGNNGSSEKQKPSLAELIEKDVGLSQRMGSLSEAALRQSESTRTLRSYYTSGLVAAMGPLHSASAANMTFHDMPQEKPAVEVDDVEDPYETAAEGVRLSCISCCRSKEDEVKQDTNDVEAVAKESSQEEEEKHKVSMRRLFQFSRPEKMLYFPAVLGAGMNGVLYPIFSLLFAGISTSLFLPTQQEMESEVRLFSFYIIGFAAGVSLAYCLDIYWFGVIGERMTHRLRGELFNKLLRQEIGFFDHAQNSVGALTGSLASDSAYVKAGVADRLGLLTRNLCIVVSGLAIAFARGWQLALVMLAIIPLLFISGILTTLAVGGLAGQDDKAHAEANQVLSESIAGIRTVSAFNMRPRIVVIYENLLQGPVLLARKKGIYSGLGFGVSNGIIFATYAIAFYFGTILISRGELDFTRLLEVFYAMSFMGFGLGQSVALAPDVGKARNATANVFKILDRKSKIDPLNPEGQKQEAVRTPGEIELNDVTFAYPTRPDANVFENLSLKVPQGSTVALVGQSGSGKSTLVGLAERFYDVSAGYVNVSGVNVALANVEWLRSQISIVSQEPQLFRGSIRDNIALGVSSDPTQVSDDKILEAAKSANANQFIEDLTNGYNTIVGPDSLSGGQKQRICIARALISPERKILLLDEATSALDNESERIVQSVLDSLVAGDEGRKRYTKIVIAHRLSTITNADTIIVFDHGRIIEMGSHDELIARDQVYAKLYRAQEITSH